MKKNNAFTGRKTFAESVPRKDESSSDTDTKLFPRDISRRNSAILTLDGNALILFIYLICILRRARLLRSETRWWLVKEVRGN